ncbi:MAG: D-alanyl-D-alanine carboxypeptidase [Treponema sp.]|jgi:D-alanyl-D-alanine carboxypeptidase (penicillin-binding protein 5/6)|nr:D-alanyl-D-alanine carboxypeptidase [Treponema sp.]
MGAVFSAALGALFFLAASLPLSGQESASSRLEAPRIDSPSAALIDAATGTTLYLKNGNTPIPPASLTKLMTAHIALWEVEAGRASLDEIVPLPPESWAKNQPPRSSLMYLEEGQIVSLRELLLGLAVPSGNDAAVAVALRFSPTVQDFVDRMNAEARRLGLRETRFVEPSGISEDNWTTAVEFAAFCREYIERHPNSLRDFHSAPEFAYPLAANVAPPLRSNVRIWRQRNHNALLNLVEGVDGLKTGYIDEAGYNIALTAARQETRLVAVILGAPAHGGSRIRDADGERLLNWGFDHFKTLWPDPPEIPQARIWKGALKWAEAVPGEPLPFTALADRGQNLRWEAVLNSPLVAPLKQGDELGTLVLSDQEGELRRIPLLAEEDIKQGNIFKRAWDSLGLFFRGFFGMRR